MGSMFPRKLVNTVLGVNLEDLQVHMDSLVASSSYIHPGLHPG